MTRLCANPNSVNTCYCPTCEEDKRSATAFVNNYLYNGQYSKLGAWVAGIAWLDVRRDGARGTVRRGNIITETHVVSGEISC